MPSIRRKIIDVDCLSDSSPYKPKVKEEKAQRKCEHGPGNRPGPLLFLKFLIILGQINKRYFWSTY